jgi:hypothetical protein
MDVAARPISKNMVSFSEQKKFHKELTKLPLVVVKRVLPVIRGCLLCDASFVQNRKTIIKEKG